MKRTSMRLVCLTVALFASAVGPAVAESQLQLSVDGIHWTDAITDPLFDPAMRWVPSDSETATFYVRNQGGSAGDLTVDILGSSAGDLIDSGDLHVTATGGGGVWTTVSQGGTHRLLTTPHVPDGQVVAVDVTVGFDFASGNATQLRASDIQLLVTLTQSSSSGSGGGSGLPGTGAPDLRWYAALSAVLIGTGTVLLRLRTKSIRKVHHV